MTKRSLSIISLAFVFIIFFAGYYLHKTKQTASQAINIGLNIWPGYGAFFIAEEKGFFKSEGIDVRLKIIQGDSEREAGLIAGDIDAIGMTLDNLVILRSRGLDVKAIYKYDNSYGADGIIAKNEYKTLNSLKGKKVGWAPATTSHFFLASALKNIGMKTNDLQHVSLSADDAGSAFAAGHLDAAVTWEPWLTRAKQGDLGHVLISTRELPIIQDVFFIKRELLIDRRKDVKKLLRACFKAVEYWKLHSEESTRIIANRLGLTIADVDAMLKGIQILDKADNLVFFGEGASSSQAYQAYSLANNIWIEEGILKESQPPLSAFDFSIIKELAELSN